MTSFAAAAVCPPAEHLGTFGTGSLFEPGSLAVDSGGTLYAVDQRNDAVFMFSYSGQLVGRQGIASPTAVGVDGDDRIYVGRAEGQGGVFEGEVIVYDRSFTEVMRLGGGFGEFEYPSAIAADAGQVYVADTKQHRVRVYDRETGGFVRSFGGYGTGAGRLVNPSAVAVSPVTGNVMVVDSALKWGQQGWSKGVGIHEFTPEGTFLRRFGQPASVTYDASGNPVYVEEAGSITVAVGAVVDNAGRVLVADYMLGHLHAFGFNGATGSWEPVCLVQYRGYSGVVPGGMTYAPDGRLFISTSGAVVELGEGEDYRKLVVEPGELRYETRQCGAEPGAQELRIRNVGPGTLDWSLAQSAGWMSVSGTAGQLVGRVSETVVVSVDRSGLGEGITEGQITVTAPGASAGADVVVAVQPPTQLSVSPASLSFAVQPGETALSQALSIQVLGGGDWSAEADAGWIGIAPSGGTTEGISTAMVSADLGGLAGGTYSGTITVRAPCAEVSEVRVPVVLSYEKGGTIRVTTNHDEASFTLSGPAEYEGGGMDYTADNVPVGSYTVEFAGIAGFKRPGSQTREVQAGQEVQFSGEYVDLRARLEILASMGSSSGGTANEIRVYGGTGAQLASVPISAFWENATAVAADVDGDGVSELVVAHDMGVLSVLRADGTPVGGLELMPFADRAYLDVAAADLDGDGADEVIVSSLNWSANGASVRVFQYSGGALVDTGIYFLAYTGEDYYWSKKNDRRGARIAAGDVDGDGLPELLSVQGGGYSRHYPYVRMFKVDTSGAVGAWGVSSLGGIRVTDADSYYSDIAAGDIDGDGVAELIVSNTTAMTAAPQVVRVLVYSAEGAKVLELGVESIRGVDVSAGDLDYDGVAEIVVGDGAFREGKSSRVRVYGGDGVLRTEFPAFDARVFGVRSSVGEFVGN